MTARWSETQKLVAAYLTTHGWPYAQDTGTGRGGVDITGVPGLAIEVKAEDGWRPTTWLRQVSKHEPSLMPPSGLHIARFVVERPKGFGPLTVHQWPVIMTLRHCVTLLHAAGYGDDDA